MLVTPSDPVIVPLSIRLLGPFEVWVWGEPLPRLRSRIGQWLLALLTLRAGSPVDRSWLAGTLWPDSPQPQSLTRLRVTLADLRRALGPEAARLRSPTPQTLAVDLSEAEVDVVAFDQAISAGDLASQEQAVALYRGSLLEGCTEGWVLQERERREQAYLQALEALAEQARKRGDAAGAERYLRQSMAGDPLRESAHRALMQVLATGGNYAAAMEVYRALRERLHGELNTQPDPETRALFHKLRAEARDRAALGSGLWALGKEGGRPSGPRVSAVPTQSPEPRAQSRSEATLVVLLYKRSAQPDEHLLTLLETRLTARGFRVFVDRDLAVGVEWAREIERQVRGADAVIPLLSAASVPSEMLQYEVQIAHEAAQQQGGKPRLLPVRVHDPDPLPEPLAALLAPLQHARWEGPQDDEGLVAELVRALENPVVPTLTTLRERLEPVGGAVPLDSAFYVVRPADEEFRLAIARQDSIVLVKGARQMGKTSLLARGLHQARQSGARMVRNDFQMLNARHLESLDALLLRLANSLADQLDLEVAPETVWEARHGPSESFRRYWQRVIFRAVDQPIVWGLDEVDRLFNCNFGSEVFGLFRAWHNDRAFDPEGPWHRLTLAIAYATEHHLFITDVNQSPFNVGTRLTLEDFTPEQVADLNRRYGCPLKGPGELDRFVHLVGGHPYLVRRGLHEMVTHGLDLAAIEAHADQDEGIFGDHLRRMLVLLARDPELREVVREILRGNPCPTAESFYRLRSAGVILGASSQSVRPRCQLYASYLRRHLL